MAFSTAQAHITWQLAMTPNEDAATSDWRHIKIDYACEFAVHSAYLRLDSSSQATLALDQCSCDIAVSRLTEKRLERLPLRSFSAHYPHEGYWSGPSQQEEPATKNNDRR